MFFRLSTSQLQVLLAQPLYIWYLSRPQNYCCILKHCYLGECRDISNSTQQQRCYSEDVQGYLHRRQFSKGSFTADIRGVRRSETCVKFLTLKRLISTRTYNRNDSNTSCVCACKYYSNVASFGGAHHQFALRNGSFQQLPSSLTGNASGFKAFVLPPRPLFSLSRARSLPFYFFKCTGLPFYTFLSKSPHDFWHIYPRASGKLLVGRGSSSS